MIKDNQKFFNITHVIIDAILIIASFSLAFWLRCRSPLVDMFPTFHIRYFFPFAIYAKILIYIVPGYLIIYHYSGMYGPKRIRTRRASIFNILRANFIGFIYFTVLMVLLKESFGDLSRWFIFFFVVINTLLNLSFRSLLTRSLRGFRKKGYNQKHVLIVGYSRAAERYIKRLMFNPEWGYHVYGILDDNCPIDFEHKGIHVIGHLELLEQTLAKIDLDEVAIALKINEYAKLEKIVALCEKSGVHTKFIPDYSEFISSKPYTEDLFGLPVINIRNVPLSNSFNKAVKRAIDIFGCLVALLLFAIPMLVVALIIKITSPGPLIYKQARIGLHNKEFPMYKFRSMRLQDPKCEKVAWTIANDPRVTTIGKFIRRTSIDELPQLFNVLKGDMSLIGPRPERPFFVEKFKEEIPRYMIKHQVRPGLTGWAQVNGYRGDTSIRLRIEHDLYYIENWSLSLDFKILFLTFFKGFINKNAY
ncbi:MAG: undecaprenyl-phosphate glucose phosphotransferase [Velocimicrobium sp.]